MTEEVSEFGISVVFEDYNFDNYRKYDDFVYLRIGRTQAEVISTDKIEEEFVAELLETNITMGATIDEMFASFDEFILELKERNGGD